MISHRRVVEKPIPSGLAADVMRSDYFFMETNSPHLGMH